jgi:hypothetical protein
MRMTKLGFVVLTCMSASWAAAQVQVARPPPPRESPEKRFEEAADRYFQAHPTRRIYIQADKPLYQPGETVHVRAFEVKTSSLAMSEALPYTFQLHDPKGAVVANISSDKSSADFRLDEGAPGGSYSITVTGAAGAGESRTVSVSQYETPRFKKKLTVLKKAYGPGDEVTATLEARTATDQPFAGRDVETTLTVDGQVQRAMVRTDERGKALLRFRLPDEMERGDAQLSAKLQDAGVSESVSARVPVVLHRMKLSFFPEGGDMVRGLPARVYFTAEDTLGKPADVAGKVLDDRGETAATFSSIHDGMGRFRFAPGPGRIYHVELTRPSGVVQAFELPALLPEGCVLSTGDDFAGAGQLKVSVRCTKSRTVLLAVYVRENRLATRTATVQAKEEHTFELELPHLSGVARVTLFSDKLEPLAERLVFRHLRQDLAVSLIPDRAHYSPRDPVEVTVATADRAGRPVSAELAVAVVDDTVLSMANDKTGHIRAHLLLERELSDSVEDPDYYFSKGSAAPAALDALLGTRGWRKFAWVQVFGPFIPERVRYGGGALYGGGAVKRKAPLPSAAPMPPMAMPEEKDAPAAAMAPPPPAARALGKAEMARDDEAYMDGARAKVRELALPVQQVASDAVRTDFKETVYWNPSVHTNAQGKAHLHFTLADSVSSFRAVAEGMTAGGLFGGGDAVISSTLPFYLEAKLPLEVSLGDRIDLPVTLRNGQSSGLQLAVLGHFGAGLKLLEPVSSSKFPLAPGEGKTVTFPLEVERAGKSDIELAAGEGPLHDSIRRTLEVAPLGFPRTESFSGTLEHDETRTFELRGAIPGTISAKLTLYPSPLATMLTGLESIVREPVGCFEQASSSNYPNVMVMSYLKGRPGTDDGAIRARVEGVLERGYRKVSSYETPERGYEWFGGAPGHEALTAYGLLEFADMRQVYGSVDAEMMARTAQWLLGRRDGQGGFQRNGRALDSFGRASPEVTNAYIVFALCEAGYCGSIRAELAAAQKDAMSTDDSYRVALVTKALLDAEPNGAGARELVARLVSQQRPDGSFHGTTHSVTRSGGKSLDVEATSLATLALVTGNRLGEARRAATWLSGQRDGNGGFGSTQATVLALKALAAYDQRAAVTPSGGEVVVRVNGVEVKRARFEAGMRDAIVLDGLGDALHPGSNEVTLHITSAEPMPFSLGVDYSSRDPADSPNAPVRLTTRLSSGSVAMGGSVRLSTIIENTQPQGQPMTLARVGLPGGATFQLWQLKELVQTHQVDFFETRPREVIFYFRALPPGSKKEISIDLVGAIPGQYTAPASQSYLYYTAEKKAWASPLTLAVTR